MAAFEALDDAALLAPTAEVPTAFAVFYLRHERAVLGFFRASTGSAELAADLAAETFAQALLSRESFRPESGEPRAWLFGIARHLLARSLEHRRVEVAARARLAMPPLVLDDDAIARIDELVGEEGQLLDLLGQLPDDQRRAIEGRVIEERRYSDIARELQCERVAATPVYLVEDTASVDRVPCGGESVDPRR